MGTVTIDKIRTPVMTEEGMDTSASDNRGQGGQASPLDPVSRTLEKHCPAQSHTVQPKALHNV